MGSEFLLNGAPVSGLASAGDTVQLNVPEGFVLSGTFMDGTPFAFAEFDADNFRNGVLWLQESLVPPISPVEISVPTDPLPRGVRSGQTLHLGDGAVTGKHFTAGWGSTVEIAGGQIGDDFEAVGANVTVAGGTIGEFFDAFMGTTVTVTGGEIGDAFEAHPNSTVNVSGGRIKRSFSALNGSKVHVSGGAIGDGVFFQTGSQVSIVGNDFRLDGMPVNGLSESGNTAGMNIPIGSVLSGTLADGTPFAIENRIFGGGYYDEVGDDVLTLMAADVPEPLPAAIDVPSDAPPQGVREGQTLTLHAGGQLPDHFAAGWESAVRILDGQVGRNLEAVGAHIAIEGGVVGDAMRAYFGSTVDINGGSVGDGLQALKGSVVNISGGVIGEDLLASEGSQLNITGGVVGQRMTLRTNTITRIAGGTIGSRITSAVGSELNILGRQFIVNGVNITDTLAPNVPFQIPLTGFGTFSAILADGSSLNLRLGLRPDDIQGTLNVILVVPEPGTFFFAAIAVLGICGCRFHARNR